MTTITRNIFLALAAAAAFGAPPTLAQQAPPARDPMTFAAFDLDANGIVTESEFTAARAQRQAARAADGAPMQGAASAPAFSEFDQNGDGQLTAEEFTAVQQARMQGRPRGPLPAPAGESPGAGATMGPGRGPGMGRDMPSFADFDADGDGALTEQEFHDARARRIQERAEQGYPMRNLANAQTFEQIDADGDGRITDEEFSAAQAQHQSQRPRTP
jgi:Ca2+-binding EF-hand superfamily protein